MNSTQRTGEEAQWSALFQELETEVSDSGFTDRVMHRVGHRARWRKAILISAFVVGGGLAVLPLLDLAEGFLAALGGFVIDWRNPVWIIENKEVLLAALTASAAPFALRWLEQ